MAFEKLQISPPCYVWPRAIQPPLPPKLELARFTFYPEPTVSGSCSSRTAILGFIWPILLWNVTRMDEFGFMAPQMTSTWSTRASARFLRAHRPFTGRSRLSIQMAPGETPWDTLPFSCGTKSFLFSGVMTPPPASQHATFPDDNRRRRTYVFTPTRN